MHNSPVELRNLIYKMFDGGHHALPSIDAPIFDSEASRQWESYCHVAKLLFPTLSRSIIFVPVDPSISKNKPSTNNTVLPVQVLLPRQAVRLSTHAKASTGCFTHLIAGFATFKRSDFTNTFFH